MIDALKVVGLIACSALAVVLTAMAVDLSCMVWRNIRNGR